MAPTMEEAEQFLKFSKIENSVIERLAQMLVTKIDDWHLIADKKTAESIWVVLTEAGRRGKLGEQIGDGDVAKQLRETFEKIRPQLECQMRSIQWNYDEIVDFDVKISKNNKSSINGDQNVQRVSVHLKILPAGETEIRTLLVDFDEAQLEDFIWKLQEASAMKHRIQKKISGK